MRAPTYYCQGIRIGMFPLMNATVVTEIEAFRILFDLAATHVGRGGRLTEQELPLFLRKEA